MNHRRPHVESVSKGHEGLEQNRIEFKKSASGFWHLAHVLVDWTLVLSLVFGGCCTYAWSYTEELTADRVINNAETHSLGSNCFDKALQWEPL